MTTPVFLVPDSDAVYAVPVEVAEKYALEGESLTKALSFLSEEGDVTGQSKYDPNKKSRCFIDSNGRPNYCGSPR